MNDKLKCRLRRGALVAGPTVAMMVGLSVCFPLHGSSRLRLVHLAGLIVLWPWRARLDGHDFALVAWVVMSCSAAGWAVVGLAAGTLFRRLRNGLLVCGPLLAAAVVGAVALDVWLARCSPGWVDCLPENCTVQSRSVNIEPEFEGIRYFIAVRCPLSPTAALAVFERNLAPREYRPRGGEGPKPLERDMNAEEWSLWMKGQLIDRKPSSADLQQSFRRSGTTLYAAAWRVEGGCVLEVYADVGL